MLKTESSSRVIYKRKASLSISDNDAFYYLTFSISGSFGSVTIVLLV